MAPLAHYVGISAQTLLHSAADDLQAHVAQFNLFYRILTIHWFASVILSACGWLLLLIQTSRRQTVLPRYTMLFNPLPVTLIIGILCSFPPHHPLPPPPAAHP